MADPNKHVITLKQKHRQGGKALTSSISKTSKHSIKASVDTTFCTPYDLGPIPQ